MAEPMQLKNRFLQLAASLSAITHEVGCEVPTVALRFASARDRGEFLIAIAADPVAVAFIDRTDIPWFVQAHGIRFALEASDAT